MQMGSRCGVCRGDPGVVPHQLGAESAAAAETVQLAGKPEPLQCLCMACTIALRLVLRVHLAHTHPMKADCACCPLQALMRPGLRCCAASCIAVAPFLLFQVYGWWSFCLPRDNARRPGWCHDTVPYLYGYVQRKYWNVGLLRFYTWRQVWP